MFSKINLSLMILIGLVPFSFALNPSLNIDLSIIRVLIPIIFLSWFLIGLIRKEIVIDPRFRAWLLIFILLFSLASVFWATDSLKAWRKILFLGSIFPLYWVIFPFLKEKSNLNLFLKIIFGTAFISAIIGLIQFLSQFIFGLEVVFEIQARLAPFFLGESFSAVVLEYNSWLVNLNGLTVFRAIGLFPDPHLFSLFLNISFPIGFYLFLKNKNKGFLIGSIVILTVSLLTFSRAGYLSLILAFLFFWLCFLRKKYISNILLILLVIIFFLIPNPINQRFFSIFNLQENSISERLTLWKTGIEITKNNFWNGVGIGNLSEEIQPLSEQRIPIYAHNLFLDFSSEIGFLGGLAVFLIIISPIVKFFKHPNDKTLLIATIFIIILTHSMFETPFYSVRLLPLILSLLAI